MFKCFSLSRGTPVIRSFLFYFFFMLCLATPVVGWSINIILTATNRLMDSLTIRLLELVENTALVEMRFLRLLPAAENFIDGEQFQFRKSVGVFVSDRLKPRTIIIFCGHFLAFGRVEIFQIRSGNGFGAA